MDACIYSSCASSSLFFFFFFFYPGFFVILILMYAFTVLVCVFDCQADFDVDNVQRREVVNFDGV